MLTIDEDFGLKIPIQSPEEFDKMEFNVTDIFLKASPSGSTEVNTVTSDYEQFLADVWVGIVLTLMVLSCVCFMCSCLIYHKFQQWKHRVLEARNASANESGVAEAELPSYTIASGLPSYEEALEQLKKVKDSNYVSRDMNSDWTPHTPPTPAGTPLSPVNLFPMYENKDNSVPQIKS